MARKSFDNITCVVVSLKDNFEDFTSIENNYNNINLNSIKNEKNTGQNLNEINDEYNAVPSVAVPKGSYNSLSQIRPTTSNNNIDINKNKIKGITLNAERSKKIKHINRITNNKKQKR